MKDQSLRVLIVEDSEDDTLLVLRALKKGGYNPLHERVETAAAMKKALKEKQWDIILCDYKMPKFNAPSAIAVLKEANVDIPIIIVSGTIGEVVAIECMRLGAQDYIMKGNLSRLCPAIDRELKEAEVRNKQRQAEEDLKESENKYRLSFENVTDVIYTIDTDLNISSVSPSVERILGYKPQDFISQSVSNLGSILTPESFERAIADISVILKGEIIPARIYQFIAKDGTIKYGEVSGSPLTLNGRIIGIISVARDITERQLAEEALKESEEKFRVLADSTPTAVMLYRDDLWIYANRAAETICGYSEKELLAMNFWDIVHPDFKLLIQERGRIRQKGEETKIRYEFKIIAKDGTEKWVDLSGASTILQGRPAGIINVLDINDRKLVEEALKESENKYRLLADNIHDVVFVLDMNMNYTYISPSVKILRGYEPEEVLKQSYTDILTPSSIALAMKTLSDVMELEKIKHAEITESLMLQLEMRRKDGTTVWTEVKFSFIRDKDQRPVGILGVTRDISERKQAENELRESEEKYRTILEDMDDVYFEVDIRGNITFVNPSSCKMSGYSKEELLGMPFKKISVPDGIEKVRQYFGEIFLTDKTGKPFLWKLVKKNGEQGFFELVASLIRDKQGNPIGFRGIGRDVTERKWAEAKLQQTLESLRKAFGATIQVMVSAVEMRDPYTAGHQVRVAELARAFATEMGLPNDKIDGIRLAGSIHDIGKLSVPAEILSKPTKLTDLEFSLIKEHSRVGYEMLKNVESPWPLAQIVYQHHERMNGSGYPRNLKGDEILIEARIMAVADVVESMASHRPYRPALGIDAALEEIVKNKGILYDAAVADACLRLFREKNYKIP